MNILFKLQNQININLWTRLYDPIEDEIKAKINGLTKIKLVTQINSKISYQIANEIPNSILEYLK